MQEHHINYDEQTTCYSACGFQQGVRFAIIMDDKHHFDSFDAFAEDLQAEPNARSIVIVGASRVDNTLVEILRAHLLPKQAKASDSDELLEGDAPLATFSARIKMCHRLGLIDVTLYSALEQLRKLRNLCAHAVAFDGAKSPARDHLSRLKVHIASRRSYALARRRYFGSDPLKPMNEWQCLILTLCILLEAIRRAPAKSALPLKRSSSGANPTCTLLSV